jgi:hypothetical protein
MLAGFRSRSFNQEMRWSSFVCVVGWCGHQDLKRRPSSFVDFEPAWDE